MTQPTTSNLSGGRKPPEGSPIRATIEPWSASNLSGGRKPPECSQQRPTIETWTASDGYVSRVRRFLPDGPPRAHLVCLHGIQSHGGWYDYSSNRLCSAGFTVHYLDRRGSGLNLQARGDAPSFRRLLDDIAEFITLVKKSTPSVPVVIVAVSWGGKLALALSRRHPYTFDAVALIAPGLFAQVGLPFRQRLRIFLARLFRPRKLFPIPLNDPALFTASEKWQQFIAKDTLSLHTATARLLVESRRLDMYLRSVPKEVKVPVLLMLADQDRIIDNAQVRTYVESLATTSKKIIEYSGAHHTLEFEPQPDRFIADLIHWLNEREQGFQAVEHVLSDAS